MKSRHYRRKLAESFSLDSSTYVFKYPYIPSVTGYRSYCVMSQNLRAHGAFHGSGMAIVAGISTPSECSLVNSGTGTKRTTPHTRYRMVGLPPRLSKAVTVLDSSDGLSGAELSLTYLSGIGDVYLE